jgi:uncharacterized protein
LLEDTLVLFRLPAWSGSDRASLVTHPKLLFFDIGVRNALLRRPLDRPHADERGLLLGHLVGLELRRREGTIWPEAQVQHFRSRRGAEVDFVVTAGRELWAIEVKASSRVDARDLKGLEDFSTRAGGKVRRRIVVFLGSRRQQQGAAEAVPLEEFLDELPAWHTCGLSESAPTVPFSSPGTTSAPTD